MNMWEDWRYEIDRSERAGELARDRRRDAQQREMRPARRAQSRAREQRRQLARSAMWLMRAAQAAAGWFL